MIAFVVNVVANLVLIPRFGITGAATAWGITILCSNLLPLAQVALALRMHPFGRGTLAAFGLTAVCFAGIPALVFVVLGESPQSLLVSLAIAMIAFGGFVWRLRHVLTLTDLVGAFRRPRQAAPSAPLS
jgi:O-antigen/teichoic acid export membrane protein